MNYDDVTEAAEAVATASLLMRILDRVEARGRLRKCGQRHVSRGAAVPAADADQRQCHEHLYRARMDARAASLRGRLRTYTKMAAAKRLLSTHIDAIIATLTGIVPEGAGTPLDGGETGPAGITSTG